MKSNSNRRRIIESDEDDIDESSLIASTSQIDIAIHIDIHDAKTSNDGNTEEAVIILSDDDKKQEVKKENDDDLVDCQDTKRVFRKRIPAISSDDEYGSKGSPLPKPKVRDYFIR